MRYHRVGRKMLGSGREWGKTRRGRRLTKLEKEVCDIRNKKEM